MLAQSGAFNPSDLALLGRVFDHKTLRANPRNLREVLASRIVQEARIAEMSGFRRDDRGRSPNAS
ncbi:hypothetical protein [Mesorhizobium huakuii]|uniref:Uncharacterized protein n=1 Tax=Mesorhizobium huakuii TaxID=28104 RepID=A0A7G6T639_9HYPH|nr:hypothetical protein [Mesorhizobium huakuii]QND62221.1 hypothetical protein HB778_39950 [Mesorhizobium huakuii]QND69678.1 hypothetical protein HB777_39720 [Mesorhizobium loti]